MNREQNNNKNTHILEAQGVEKVVALGQETIRILEPISLSIKAGQSLAIVGESGSGKSTLLGLLAGLDQPSAGSIILAGHTLTDLDEDQRASIRAQYVGFVFQSFQLMPNLTALENVMLPLEILDEEEPQERALEMLNHVGLGHRLKHYPKQLSGGEQQRVAVARAFVTHPALLFADEPTGNLDRATGGRIADLLFQLNEENNTTLVLVTHDPGLAARCEKKITIDAGCLKNDNATHLEPP
ncbi:MAG: ABC transporter ATP-binding protein, partial [Pseudomonadales bacterium]|nr:ABC transporter ATP-binding protein [Pseudomonadales bacterium]